MSNETILMIAYVVGFSIFALIGVGVQCWHNRNEDKKKKSGQESEAPNRP